MLGVSGKNEKIFVDSAYKKVFYNWVKDNIIGLDIEFSAKPPTGKGFVPVKWRWVNQRTFGWLNFFRRHSKDYEKTAKSAEVCIDLKNLTKFFRSIINCN